MLFIGATVAFLCYGCTKGSESGDVGMAEIPEEWHYGGRRELSSLVGLPMPAIKVGNWLEGKQLGPDEMKDKIIVVDIWTTWCGPCLNAIPHNNALHKKYASQGVVVLGVCTAQERERMAEVAKATGIEYYCAEDINLETQSAWKVPFYPTYCVVDRKGVVRAAGILPSKVEAVVEKLLAEK
jgi:thiol-disulfide isomerase/thioredoxin